MNLIFQQEEEVEALKAIYDLDFRTLSAERRTYTLRIQPIGGDCHAPCVVELWVCNTLTLSAL